jgi:hypothetical protein
MKRMKNYKQIFMEFVQNGYHQRKIGIQWTEPSDRYRGVRYFDVSLHP